MATDVELECRCGKVHGWLREASARTVNRLVCYCDDCQAFVHHLGRGDLLDASGGTDIIQVAAGSLSFDRGTENITGLRLGPKGLFRWYASCCKTPVGNTVTPVLPLVGVPHEVFKARASRVLATRCSGRRAATSTGSSRSASRRRAPLRRASASSPAW